MNHRNNTSAITTGVFSLILLISLPTAPAWSFQARQPSRPAAKHNVPINIHGHVTDESGNPLAGVTLTVKWTERTTVTNQTGEFTLENVLEKDTIEVNHPGYQHYKFTGQKSIANYFIMLKPPVKGSASTPSEVERKARTADSTPRNAGATMDITGKIYDDKGVGLVDAFLIVKGTGQGIMTSNQGEFTLKAVPVNGSVIISHISFIPSEIKVQKSQTNYEYKLSKDLKILDEVVVVGYAPSDDGPKFKNPDQNGQKSANGDFIVVEQNPEFPGGTQELYKFLGRNIRYPSAASRSRISGKAFISFTVDTDGIIRNPKIIKGLGFGIDEEVLRVVLQMPKWNPARQNGKPVSKEFALPVSFNLE